MSLAGKPESLYTCQVSDEDAPCNRAAVWHVWVFDGSIERLFMECNRHVRRWDLHLDVKLDFHLLDPVCGLPDAIWQFSSDKQGDGRCMVNWGGVEAMMHSEAMVPA